MSPENTPNESQIGAQGDKSSGMRDSPPNAEQTQKPDWLRRFEVLSKFAISLTGLVLSGVIGFATIYYSRQTALLQLRNQEHQLALQRQIAATQILIQLLAILREAGQDRAILLDLIIERLKQLAPELAQDYGESLLAQATTPAEREQAQEIIASSEKAKQELNFSQHMENARKYREFGLDAAAAREYMKAYDALPEQWKQQLGMSIQVARRSYEKGEFAVAARKFEETLRDVTIPFPQG